MRFFSNFLEKSGIVLLVVLSFVSSAQEFETLEIKMKDGNVYVFPGTELSEEASKRFSELSESAQESFLKKRSEILMGAARSLHGLRIPVGIWRKKIRPQLDWLYGKSIASENPDLNFQETGFVSIQQVLKELDKNLWLKCETISNVNEYGLAFEVGVSGGGKAGARGFYGITGLGVTVTVDPLERAVALELFGDLEITKRVTPFYAGAGVFLTLMGSAMSTDWRKKLCVEQGSAFCVPGLVGFMSDRYVGLGTSKELGIGFPGTVLMESGLSRLPILRIGASPHWPGFIRVKTAAGPALETVFRGVKNLLLNTCSVLFTRIR